MSKKIFWTTLAILCLLITSQGLSQRSFNGHTASASAEQQFILVIRDSQNRTEDEFYDVTMRTLYYARLNYDELDLATTAIWPRLGQYSAILILTESLEKISPLQSGDLLAYVDNGGGLAMMKPGWNPALAPLFGYQAGMQVEFAEQYEAETGVHFVSDFFPGLKGLVLSSKLIPGHSRLDLPPPQTDQARVLVTTDSGKPVAWQTRYGQGRTIFWNSDFATTRDSRGMVVQSVLSVQPVAALPIANFATYQIDDFPAAVSTEKLEPIKSEYDMTMVDFYHQVWVPDVMAVSERYDVPYTFLIPFNYNPLIEPPFDFKEWEHAKVTIDGQEVEYATLVSHLVAQGHEMGLHGYNHVSLLAIPDYWIPNRDREAWDAAALLVDAQKLLDAEQIVERLSAQARNLGLTVQEQAQLDDAERALKLATEDKYNGAANLLQAKTDLDTLTAKERAGGLTPKEKSVKTLAAQKVELAGQQKLAEAQSLVTLDEAALRAIVLNEARATATAAGADKIAEAAQVLAELEQKAEDNMALGLAEASRRWEADNIGPQPVTYVPPNNIFHPAGLRALRRGFPTINILAGVYTGHFPTGGHREYGPEVWDDYFFTIPRITAEYTMTPSSRYSMISMLGTMGVWTHFVHPDDVFHTPGNYPLSSFHRNPNSLPWRGDHTGEKNGYYYHMIEWLDFNEENFPWMRYTRTDESYEILSTHFDNEATIEISPDALRLNSAHSSFYFVRINNGQRIDLNGINDAQLVDVHHGEGYRLYVLRGLESKVTMDLLPAQETDTLPPPPVTITPLPQPTAEENVVDYQSSDTWGMAPIPTTEPTETPVVTATPDFGAIPIPTPTMRSRR